MPRQRITAETAGILRLDDNDDEAFALRAAADVVGPWRVARRANDRNMVVVGACLFQARSSVSDTGSRSLDYFVVRATGLGRVPILSGLDRPDQQKMHGRRRPWPVMIVAAGLLSMLGHRSSLVVTSFQLVYRRGNHIAVRGAHHGRSFSIPARMMIAGAARQGWDGDESCLWRRRSRRRRPNLLQHRAIAATTSQHQISADDEARQEEDDNIYAVASGGGSSSTTQATAVALIRISGPQAKHILQSLLGNNQTFPKPRYACLRRLYHPKSHIQIDQALVLYFSAPNSYTGEDCVELHCHGSRAVIAALLAALSSSTVSTTAKTRLAEPGEFTQRAFAHGKLDVLQVEGLADLLASDTEQQRQVALAQLEGHVSAIYRDWRDILIAALAHAEAVIDFGDDEMNSLEEAGHDDDHDTDTDGTTIAATAMTDTVWGGVTVQVQSLVESMREQLSRSRNSELLRLGVRIAIVGPPNAGKSSLFNLLAQRPAAIVSNVAGTTRDVLEVAMDLGGMKCLLQDTAGIRDDTNDVIEQEGMKRALAAAQSAHIVVLLVDHNAAGGDDDPQNNNNSIVATMLPTLLETHDAKDLVLVYNKIDLAPDDHYYSSKDHHNADALVSSVHRISCVTQQGLDEFLADLTNRVAINPDDDGLITRARHRQHVEAASEALERFIELSAHGSVVVDLAAEELRLAASELGRITGAVDVEDILDKLFTDFCIGK
jgi:tRNA modification GTPase